MVQSSFKPAGRIVKGRDGSLRNRTVPASRRALVTTQDIVVCCPGDPNPHPAITYSAAFRKGWEASLAGLSKSLRNPFVPGSDAFRWWRKGWEAKFFQEPYSEINPDEEKK